MGEGITESSAGDQGLRQLSSAAMEIQREKERTVHRGDDHRIHGRPRGIEIERETRRIEGGVVG